MCDTLPQPATLTHAGTYVDLTFPAFGNAIPRDHGYALYGAIARHVPWLHGDEAKAERAGIFPVRGMPGGDRTLLLGPGSAVRLRVPAARLPLLLGLAGRTLTIDGARLNVGVPRVEAMAPAAALICPLVLIKLAATHPLDVNRQTANAPAADAPAADAAPPDAFLAAARKQLDTLTIAAEVGLLTHANGPHQGQPRRRVIRVKTQTHVGYAMIVQGLTADESVRLQEHGLGGRRLMGCGLFLPAGDER